MKWAAMVASGAFWRNVGGVIPFAFAAWTPTMARPQSAPSDWVPPHSVFVHVDSPDPVELQGESGEKRNPFYTICVSPCDTVVPAVGQYRVSGDATRPSRRFVLPEGADHDTIKRATRRLGSRIHHRARSPGGATGPSNDCLRR